MSSTVVTTKSGKLRGIARRANSDPYDYHAFLGIPYAEPPTGELRFQDPLPVRKWSEVRDASKFGPLCAQLDAFLNNSPKGSDDCLYLNVYTKSPQNGEKKATMVWIHGGAFIMGSGDDDFYGPEFLLRKDIVLVTINYRVGILGFLNLDDEEAPGNQGLKDMVLALKWVKDNIENFGGDPNNVTIFGESAGGAAVHYLTISPLAKGLFQKAIIQSGSVTAPWAHLDNPRSFVSKLCEHLGCDLQNPKDIAKFLRKIDCSKLAEAQHLIRTDEEKVNCVFPFGPTVDCKSREPFMPKHPIEMAKNGVCVPIIVGHTESEGIFMVPVPEDPRPRELIMMGCKMEDLVKIDENFEQYLHPRWAESMRKNYGFGPRDIKRIYFGNEKLSTNTLQQWADFNSDVFFVEGIHDLIDYQIRKNSDSTFFYVLTYDGGLSLKKLMNIKMKGVCHGDDLGYLFSRSMFQDPIDKDTKDWKVVDQMTELWTNFAKTGNPTPTTSDLIPCKWQPVTNATTLSYLNIGEELKMDMMKNVREKYTKAK